MNPFAFDGVALVHPPTHDMQILLRKDLVDHSAIPSMLDWYNNYDFYIFLPKDIFDDQFLVPIASCGINELRHLY
jgi:hypothetical protein